MADSPKAASLADHHIGARLRMRRLQIGLSQERLAAALGLTFQQVQKYEKGTNRIGAGRLLEIARILDVPAAFFFEGAPGGPASRDRGEAPEELQQLFASRDGIALAQAYLTIRDPGVRRSVVDLIEHLAAAARVHP
jgi:transcriptional regulator with XRE-family HTH domain